MIELRARKHFPSFAIDAEIVIEPEESGIVALFGKSGCGKTSIINMIAGLLRPDAGKVAIDGRVLFDSAAGVDIPPYRRDVGYVFQDARLFPHMTVKSNLLYGAGRQSETRFDLGQITDLLDIGHLLTRRPGELSGGEKQRVSIGRTILSNPRILLMDEPLASLDGARKAEILPFIQRLRDELGLPIIYVSHSIEEVVRLADVMVLIDDGRVAASGDVGDITSRLDLYPLTGRYEAGSVLAATVKDQDADYGLTVLDTPGGDIRVPQLSLPPGQSLRLRIRARDVALAIERPTGTSFQNILSGTVREIGERIHTRSDAAADAMVEVSVDIGAPLRVRITRKSLDELGLRTGSLVYALIKAVAIDKHTLGRGAGSEHAARYS
ncbi:molybdenum ABC transporter ATP-binding protein [Hwanghaeella grinnelliae]|uniref:Molybdenum ABC transporter ATP-binding protein n=1 Tax=Hwanghaeella grinnelliae TaxID=2500179 RepID=A0A437QHP3_9PROT|nr:molybdenum ABC transporter ATP-binding protein [Hwanghaeella grinnelliae]RVU34039.1 molybdenum ABC transporter ATP-binding protein [Hwanghaeella grinnelliae]